MAFADPIVVSLGGASKNLVRIDSGRFTSEYRLVEATQEFRLLIRNQELKAGADGRVKTRHNMSLRWVVYATATTPQWEREAQLTATKIAGDDITLWDDVILAISALGTAPNALKLANMES